ncbi:MAG: type II toxin-antitoxin system RelE/ParE family toxin [Halieaceae bacterium]
MAKYELRFKRSVAKDLRAVTSKRDIKKILQRIEALTLEPRPVGSKKLAGMAYYRIRQGCYRIIYEILDQRLIVHVIRVAQRSRLYK